jgi:hypothetical protein
MAALRSLVQPIQSSIEEQIKSFTMMPENLETELE